ncbi:MAG: hypothetical protein HY092_02570 [Candidatus Kerfeldbacteria bacterium]|nr:hypothetical protein [Candidatus Kerfeldbacteria bacterium]
MSADLVHRFGYVKAALPGVAVPTKPSPETSGVFDWLPLTAAVVLAVGLAAAGLGHDGAPLGLHAGRVLGAATTAPLIVTVDARWLGNERTVRVQPKTGTLLEALARAAHQAGGALTYESRGDSAYLQSFLNDANDASGQWVIMVNSRRVVDLMMTLKQGDVVSVIRVQS